MEKPTNVAPRVVRCESHHESALLAFLREAFPDTPLKSDPRFHRWRFQDGPHGDSTPHCFLAMVGDKVVGQLAAMRDRIWWKGEWRDCIWMLDLMILPGYRGGYTAVRLFQAVMKSADLLLVVGAGPHVMGFYKSLGWRHVHVAGTMFAILRPNRLLELASSVNGDATSGFRKLLLRLATPGVRLVQRAYVLWASRGAEHAEVVSDLPPDIADLEQTLRPRLGVTTDRSLAALNWKFTHRPFGTHFFVTLRSSDGNALRAVAAVKLMQRSEAHWAEVVDYLADPDNGKLFRRLMALVVKEAQRLELDFIRVRCSIRNHVDALHAPFWMVRNRPVIDDLLIYSKDKQLVDELAASKWHLTTIVSDRTDHGGDEVTSAESMLPRNTRRRSPQS